MIDNQPFIVQEKLGMSIKDILKKNNHHFTFICIVNLGIQLLTLLERLHKQGYIHCDIKPDNIMIGDFEKDRKLKDKVYLIDFGISQKYVDS